MHLSRGWAMKSAHARDSNVRFRLGFREHHMQLHVLWRAYHWGSGDLDPDIFEGVAVDIAFASEFAAIDAGLSWIVDARDGLASRLIPYARRIRAVSIFQPSLNVQGTPDLTQRNSKAIRLVFPEPLALTSRQNWRNGPRIAGWTLRRQCCFPRTPLVGTNITDHISVPFFDDFGCGGISECPVTPCAFVTFSTHLKGITAVVVAVRTPQDSVVTHKTHLNIIHCLPIRSESSLDKHPVRCVPSRSTWDAVASRIVSGRCYPNRIRFWMRQVHIVR
jgi:hypothetical protein